MYMYMYMYIDMCFSFVCQPSVRQIAARLRTWLNDIRLCAFKDHWCYLDEGAIGNALKVARMTHGSSLAREVLVRHLID